MIPLESHDYEYLERLVNRELRKVNRRRREGNEYDTHRIAVLESLILRIKEVRATTETAQRTERQSA